MWINNRPQVFGWSDDEDARLEAERDEAWQRFGACTQWGLVALAYGLMFWFLH